MKHLLLLFLRNKIWNQRKKNHFLIREVSTLLNRCLPRQGKYVYWTLLWRGYQEFRLSRFRKGLRIYFQYTVSMTSNLHKPDRVECSSNFAVPPWFSSRFNVQIDRNTCAFWCMLAHQRPVKLHANRNSFLWKYFDTVKTYDVVFCNGLRMKVNKRSKISKINSI